MSGWLSKIKENKQQKEKEKYENFIRDIKEKKWGKALDGCVGTRYSSIQYEELSDDLKKPFEETISKTWGITVKNEDAAWAWNELMKEKEKRVSETLTNAVRIISEEKLQNDLEYGTLEISLLSFVKNHYSCWDKVSPKNKKDFKSLLDEKYPHIGENKTSIVWNEITNIGIVKNPIPLGDSIKNLGNEDAQIRKESAIGLGLICDKRAARPLLEIINNDSELEVQMAAAQALVEIGHTDAIGNLINLEKRISYEKAKLENEKIQLYNIIYQDPNYWKLECNNLNMRIKKMIHFESMIQLLVNRLKQIKFAQMAVIAEGNLREMDWQDFQDKVIEALGGTSSNKKTSDMGLDGISCKGVPIQVKQSDNIGRNVVDNFETALRRYYPSDKKLKKGIIVAFSFTKGAYDEVHRAMVEDNIEIDLVTVEELLET